MAALWKYNVTVQFGTTHEAFTQLQPFIILDKIMCAYIPSKTENEINVKTSEIID